MLNLIPVIIQTIGTKMVSDKLKEELKDTSTNPEKIKVVSKYMLKNGFNWGFISLGMLVVVNAVFGLNIDFNLLFSHLARLISFFNGF